MEEADTSLPTTHLLAPVPAVVSGKKNVGTYLASDANLQTFPPNQGHQHPNLASSSGFVASSWIESGTVYSCLMSLNFLGDDPALFINSLLNRMEWLVGEGGPPPTNNWMGVFNIASYTQYFNVDTDIVLNRLLNSLDPRSGDFFSKIDANPDLYGLIWVSTTLVLVIASLGNLATYLISSSSWSFDVSYMSLAASTVYGYAIVVPLAFYFLLQYLGSNASLVHFWCMWGYSLFIFVLSSFLLVIPVELLRWMIILVAGGGSAGFVASNLSSYAEGNDLMVVWVAALILQFGFGLFIKIWFFP